MRLALLLVLLFLVAFYRIYKDYEGDKRKFLLDIGMLLFLLAATGFSKYARVYLPLFVTHILLLLTSWGAYFLYLYGKSKRVFLIFAPILSIGAFFIIGYFASHS